MVRLESALLGEWLVFTVPVAGVGTHAGELRGCNQGVQAHRDLGMKL